MPSPRTTDGALTAYLMEHHRDAWRPGDDALATTTRLLGELAGDRDAFAAEAQTANGQLTLVRSQLEDARKVADQAERDAQAANGAADRLANTAATLRRERDDAQIKLDAKGIDLTIAIHDRNEYADRAKDADRERDEARAELAALRQGIADVMAKMGGAHG